MTAQCRCPGRCGAYAAAGLAPEAQGEAGVLVPHGLSGAGVVGEVAATLSTFARRVPVSMAEGLDEVTTVAELQECQFTQKKLTLEVATHTAGSMEQTLLRVQDDATLDLARREKAAVRLRPIVANRFPSKHYVQVLAHQRPLEPRQPLIGPRVACDWAPRSSRLGTLPPAPVSKTQPLTRLPPPRLS